MGNDFYHEGEGVFGKQIRHKKKAMDSEEFVP